MTEQKVLIVGAGLAGLSCAIGLSRKGVKSLVIDQAPQIGGNIHRQPAAGSKAFQRHKAHVKRWQTVTTQLEEYSQNIEIRCQTQFIGIDKNAMAFVAGTNESDSQIFKPQALVLATGASERVIPRPGWTLPNVSTVGALQTGLKTTGLAPKGKIVLAGSGPFLLAACAELVKAGNPPVGVIEAANPNRHFLAGLSLPVEYLKEASSYMRQVFRARVPYHYGARVQQIERTETGQLQIQFFDFKGRSKTINADHIGLHDGLKQNDYGLDMTCPVKVFKAGDCREILGAYAAQSDGFRIAEEIAHDLIDTPLESEHHAAKLTRHLKAQAVLKKMYSHSFDFDPQTVSDDMILCRCENRTVGDLKLLNKPTEREARLMGRFAMGACQGRFCHEWVTRLADLPPDRPIGRSRWPIRPVSVQSLIDAEINTSSSPQE